MKTFQFTNDPQYNKDILINNNWFEDIEDEPIILSMNEEDDEPTPMIFLERVDEFSYTDENIFKEEVKEELPTPPQSEDEEEEEDISLYIDPPKTEQEEEEDVIEYPNENEDFTKPHRNTFYRVRKSTEKYVYITKLTQDTLKSVYQDIMNNKPFRKKIFYDELIHRYYIFIRPNDKRDTNKYYYPPLLKKCRDTILLE